MKILHGLGEGFVWGVGNEGLFFHPTSTHTQRHRPPTRQL